MLNRKIEVPHIPPQAAGHKDIERMETKYTDTYTCTFKYRGSKVVWFTSSRYSMISIDGIPIDENFPLAEVVLQIIEPKLAELQEYICLRQKESQQKRIEEVQRITKLLDIQTGVIKDNY